MKFKSKSKLELPSFVEWLDLLWPALAIGFVFFLIYAIFGEQLYRSLFKGISVALIFSASIAILALYAILTIWFKGQKIFKILHAIEIKGTHLYYSYQPFIKGGKVNIKEISIIATKYLDKELLNLSVHKKDNKKVNPQHFDAEKTVQKFLANNIGYFEGISFKAFDELVKQHELEIEIWPAIKRCEESFKNQSFSFDFYTKNEEPLAETDYFELLKYLKEIPFLKYIGETEYLNKEKTLNNTEHYFVFENADLLASITICIDNIEIECSKSTLPKALIKTFEEYNLILDHDE